MRLYNSKGTIDQVNSFSTNLSVLGISDNQEEISRKDRYSKKSIAKNGTNFKTEFWKQDEHMTLTKEEKALINSGMDNKN